MSKIKYRGPAVAFQGQNFAVNENGVATTTLKYLGLTEALKGLAGTFPVGNKIDFQNDGPVSRMSVTVGFLVGSTPETPIDKWEDDAEKIEIDLSNSYLAQGMTQQKARQALNDYRQMTPSERDSFKIADYIDPTSADAQTLSDLMYEVDRGVDSVEAVYLVLKRTRTMSAGYLSPRKLTLKQEVYSTAQLIAMEAIPSIVADMLPISPYPPPENTQWAWRPRLSNRAFIGRGLVEEQSDWVFGPHSTILFTYVA